MKPDIETLIAIRACKLAFGTLAVLDNVKFEDLSAILEFAVVINNYNKMKECLAKEDNKPF